MFNFPADKHESLLQVDSIIFDGFGQAYPNYLGKFAIFWRHLKKEVKNEIRNLTALACSNATLTIYYASNVLPPLTLILSQYGIHAERFLHLINCLYSVSSLLFQIMVGACKLVCCLSALQYNKQNGKFLGNCNTMSKTRSCLELPIWAKW